MRYQHIIEALYHQPLAISQAGFKALDAFARPILFEGKRPDTDFWGDPMDGRMIVENDVAVISVKGPLLLHAELLEKQCGATSYDDIREDLESAAKQKVRMCVLNINSPGGQVIGCLETAEFIAAFQDDTRIPVIAFTDSQMCSAAYFLAAGCDIILAARSALVGSIGVIMALVDESQAFADAGLEVRTFTSGKYKAAGTEGLPVNDDHAEYLQGTVDDAFAQFAGHVTSHRTTIQMDSMQGQSMWGEEALPAGLIDDWVDSLSDVVELLDSE